MDEYATVDPTQGLRPPEALQALFNDADEVRVQKLPCALPGLTA